MLPESSKHLLTESDKQQLPKNCQIIECPKSADQIIIRQSYFKVEDKKLDMDPVRYPIKLDMIHAIQPKQWKQATRNCKEKTLGCVQYEFAKIISERQLKEISNRTIVIDLAADMLELLAEFKLIRPFRKMHNSASVYSAGHQYVYRPVRYKKEDKVSVILSSTPQDEFPLSLVVNDSLSQSVGKHYDKSALQRMVKENNQRIPLESIKTPWGGTYRRYFVLFRNTMHELREKNGWRLTPKIEVTRKQHTQNYKMRLLASCLNQMMKKAYALGAWELGSRLTMLIPTLTNSKGQAVQESVKTDKTQKHIRSAL